jgi:hypothetical protein
MIDSLDGGQVRGRAGAASLKVKSGDGGVNIVVPALEKVAAKLERS